METSIQQKTVAQGLGEGRAPAIDRIDAASPTAGVSMAKTKQADIRPTETLEKGQRLAGEAELEFQVQERMMKLDEMNRVLRAEVLERQRAETELRASETRWYTLFAQAGVGLAEISLQGKFERANDKFCGVLGWSRSGLLGRNIVDIIHPDDLHRSLALFRRVTATGEPESFDQRYLRSDGTIVWVNSQMTRIADSDERPRAILIAVIDLTDRKKTEVALHRSEAEFRAFFELAAVGIAQVDAEKRLFLRVNRRFSEMTGYNEFELRQMSFAQLDHAEDPSPNRELFDQLLSGGVNEYSVERQLRRKNEALIWVNVTASLVRDPQRKPLRTVMVVQDITQRKNAEAALRRAHEQLELRVRERTVELDQVNRALMAEIIARKKIEEERQSVLRQLVSVQEEERRRISRELHDDIGQHLTALMLGLSAIDPRNDNLTTKAQLEELQQITTIVGKEVHDLALELRPTALDDLGLVRTLANYLEDWAARARLEMDFHSVGFEGGRLPSPIETTLYRIVQEAVNNVLKHAQAKGVSVIIERRCDHASAIIEDDGRGFDVDSLKNVDSRQRLGLLGMEERAALVRGELRIESSPGQGTTVFVRIPLPHPKEADQHG